MYKIGICLDCIDGKPKPLVSGRCRIHYQKYRHKVWSKKLPKKKYVHWYKKRGSQPPHERGLLIAQLDRVFSKYIRTMFANKDGTVNCFTCTCSMTFPAAQCGHYMVRKNLATRWHEDNARPQDLFCNCLHDGKHDIFRANLVAEIGVERVEAVERLSKTTVHFSKNDLESLLIIFKDKLSKLQ